MATPIRYMESLLRPKPKIHRLKPVAHISEAPFVLMFQQYFCISYSGRFLEFYFPFARPIRKRPYFDGFPLGFGVLFGRFAQIYGGIADPLNLLSESTHL